MKNLANLNIEFLDELPIDLLSLKLKSKHQIEFFNRYYKYTSYRNKKTEGLSPYDRAEKLLQKNIGRSFGDTFSLYCKQVPKYQQFIFLDQFQEYNACIGRHSEEYSIDENDNIIYTPYSWKTKHRPFIESKDYKVEFQHRITGHNKDCFSKIYEKIEYERATYNWLKKDYSNIVKDFKDGKFLYYEYKSKFNPLPLNVRYRAQKKDFIPVIVSGWRKEFSSRNDPEFMKYNAEKRSKDRKSARDGRKLKAQVDYESLIKKYTLLCEQNRAEIKRKQLEAIEKEKQANLVKIISHGFDPITSFRN